jgi:hypothetical protein
MQKRLRYIAISLFVVSCFQTNGQTLLLDSLKAQRERQEYSFIRIPAYYQQLSQKFNLSNIKSTDSFSLRLWTGSMFGYNLITFENKNTHLESHSYNYYSDTSIKEIKLNPKISTLEFLNKLEVFNFANFVSQYQIQDFKDNVEDGTWYTLEIIKGKNYKVFQYHSPELFKDADNKKFSEVIKLLDKYFYERD